MQSTIPVCAHGERNKDSATHCFVKLCIAQGVLRDRHGSVFTPVHGFTESYRRRLDLEICPPVDGIGHCSRAIRVSEFLMSNRSVNVLLCVIYYAYI